MILHISHETRYSYSGDVMPGIHYLHFHPQLRSYIKLLDFNLQVLPAPDALTARTDPENNLYHQCWFSAPTRSMEIHADIRVETKTFNPFEFLIDTHGPQGTEQYRRNSEEYLKPFLAEADVSEELKAFTDQFSQENALDYFVKLTEAIAAEWDHHERMEQNILDVSTCFSRRAGSCRDLARMMMAMLRCSGLPSRFVSGYSYGAEDVEAGHELHAWVEAFIAGAGWVGTDPSLGLLTTERYIPVAASFDPQRTMPVQGFYHGSATSLMETRVSIREDQP